ncbi:E3 ubiquitin/ISG15 ligase TRIM25-like isoform X2 [Sparus aurata]|uniref:E3 ubiquitin/ISG15 ligase TRIM25-like isoform X2 n=1 Tax=Sparus aurata TaxID=8175 RepID=UPI0011C110C6|nr:E3 ubiquitin/ISG15 ligase TRIM25-like isoform X2 [Sparus aurata]
MAQQNNQLDREKICCSVCLDLLKDPVTIPCGHSYCMNCIQSYWDTEDEKKTHSCPQCRQSFTPRPVLVKNTMLADLVEELKKTGLQAAPADLCYAGPEDVACDVCTGRKLRAVKSCLACMISFCKKHLQPHYDSPAYEKHKLVEPSEKLQENICSRHDEVMKMFCRTDQQCICYLCSVDEHKGHDTVSAAAERTERQRELEGSRHNIQQRIQDREEDVKLLQQEVEAINGSADKAVEHSEKIFTQLIRLMEERRSDVKQQVRSQQETEVSRVKELQEKLEQEITELKRKDAELKKLSHTEDHNQFLHNYPSLSALSESTHSSSIKIRPLNYFEDVTVAVSELRDKLQDVLRETWTNISLTETQADVLLSQPENKTRAGFLRFSSSEAAKAKSARTSAAKMEKKWGSAAGEPKEKNWGRARGEPKDKIWGWARGEPKDENWGRAAREPKEKIWGWAAREPKEDIWGRARGEPKDENWGRAAREPKEDIWGRAAREPKEKIWGWARVEPKEEY